MNNTPKLIVMLTHNDHTVENASEIFESCKHSNAEYWGFNLVVRLLFLKWLNMTKKVDSKVHE